MDVSKLKKIIYGTALCITFTTGRANGGNDDYTRNPVSAATERFVRAILIKLGINDKVAYVRQASKQDIVDDGGRDRCLGVNRNLESLTSRLKDALLHKKTYVIYMSEQWFNSLSPAARQWLLAHEGAHIILGHHEHFFKKDAPYEQQLIDMAQSRADEDAADDYATARFGLKGARDYLGSFSPFQPNLLSSHDSPCNRLAKLEAKYSR